MINRLTKTGFFILMIILINQPIMAQTNYQALWKSVDRLEEEGKTKDALKSVESIILKARKDKNTTQTVKGLLHKYNYMMTLEEASELKVVNGLKKEIEQSQGTDRAVLQSILGELYWQYFNENTWKFSNRTETDEKQSDDFRTWDLKTLFKEINGCYLGSLEDVPLLQQTKLENYKDILSEEKGSKGFRPTLYDLLAHRAIDYFNEDKSNLAESSNAFSIDDKRYFATASEFVNIKLPDQDKNSGGYNALRIYQQLLAIKLKSRNTLDELADADLKRIQYVREHYYNKEENDPLFFEALKRIRSEYVKCNTASVISYKFAYYLYEHTEGKNREEIAETIKSVLAICNETINNYPGSEGAKNCAVLKETFFYKNLSFTTEQTVVPDQPFKALLSYKNITRVYFKIIPVDYKEKDKIFTINEKETKEDVVKRLNAIKPVRKWNILLPNTTDHIDHSAEIKIDALKKGFYAILVSTNPSFSIRTGKEAIAYQTLFSSQISYVTKNNNNEKYFEMHVLDRNTGEPLKNAQVKFYRSNYDYKTRKYVRAELGTQATDASGYVAKKLDKPSVNYYSENFQFDITYNNAFLPSEQSYYQYYYPWNETPAAQRQIHLFTDRSIYRPGQTIFVKGIFTERNGETHKILANQKIKVTFRDVNYQEIKSQEFTTNEFGSFTGMFTAPVSGLMGSMSIHTDYGTQSVQVEEYKRPKFEVAFEPVKKAFNLNDTVSVTGKATSYSGADIDNAEVKYSVRRVAEFPVWCWWGWRRPWFPPSNEKIVKTGVTTTDANGNFTIDFNAVPDLSISKEFKPYFNYEVTADVVDINGETHSSVTTVRVGYLAIEADLSVSDNMDAAVENKIAVSTNNLNGEPEATDVVVKLYNLLEPLQPRKARLWDEPDMFLMTRQEHDKIFPYEVYDKEDLMSNWSKGNLVNSYTFNTEKQKEIILAPASLQSGAYRIEFSCMDKNGNLIEFKKTLTVSSSNNDLSPVPKSFAFFKTEKTTVKPGDNILYKVGTSMQNAFAIVEIAFKGKLLEKKVIPLNNEIKSFSFAVKEEYKGGVEISYVLVNKNRNYTGSQFISVPYEDKSLRVEWLTFRDKLLPGQKEQWRLKISGTNKEKMTSELLAGMYDASLDAFLPHSWSFYLSQSYYSGYLGTYTSNAFGQRISSLYTSKDWNPYTAQAFHNYDGLNLFGLSLGGYHGYNRYFKMSGSGMAGMSIKASKAEALMSDAAVAKEEADMPKSSAPTPPAAPAGQEQKASDKKEVKSTASVVPRTNLNETAFFLPQLQTDADGNIILNFQMPEALTKWNFLGLAHTKDLNYQYFTKSIVTQKELMVTPNAPRFLREGDILEFTTKITNLSDKNLSGKADLVLYDAMTMKEITPKIMEAVHGRFNTIGERDFSVEKGRNTAVSWTLQIPSGIDAVTYKVVASAENFSDGEQATLVVLPNRMMVTETMPLWVRGQDRKSYTFGKLLNNKSTTLKNYNLTLEMSSQPVWYAVQALPYMMEYPFECAEQIFSRYYANTLASYIASQNPKIKTIFEKWKNTDALLSNLEKNQELKAVLLEETPWVRDAQNETEQKKRIALLFDLTKMADEQQKALQKLMQMQTPNGGFTWFPGMPENRYITQHIVAGLGHLSKLEVLNLKKNAEINGMLQKAVAYLDDRLTEDLENIKKYDKDYLKKNHLYHSNIHALYARSFFDFKMEDKNKEAYDYFLQQAKDNWLNQDLYSKAMLALVLQRTKEKPAADKIIVSLKQNAINSEELGMYWKANETGGWYWYQAPVETQALLIEAFHEVANDNKSVDEMKVWLLKQKQTTSWKSTKATAEACYALLLQGKDWTKSDQLVQVSMNGKTIDPMALGATVEPGTGYYKISWKPEQITPSMAKIELKKKDKGPAWGAVYWQYFEDLDKISGAATSLQLTKKLFKEENTGEGKKLITISDKTPLRVGDVVKVRIELRTDRNLEYVHLKDMRAAGFEPVNVLSQYKYQDGLGYYESTKDVATHFFMDWMQKGVYVFEYSMRVTIAGNFSNGITLIESMYAPEFKSHSKGERVTIVRK
jgi:uncharacterized protein YfaS (alpha-2-macroglobulin family)